MDAGSWSGDGCKRSDFWLALRIRQRTKFRGGSARDRCGFVACLEAGEVGPVAPGQRTTQSHARLHRGVVNDVDRALVIGGSLLEARKVPEVAAGGEDRRDTRNLCDLVGVLQAFERLNHEDQHDVGVDRVAVPSGNATPHRDVERLATALTAPPERREVRPITGLNRLCYGVD